MKFTHTGATVTVGEETVTETTVKAGESVTFTVAVDSTGNYTTPIEVKVGDNPLTPTEEGGNTYTIKVTADTTVTVTATEVGPSLPAATVVVDAAIIGASTSDTLNNLQSVTGAAVTNNTSGAVAIATANGMPIHKNNADKEGAWVGFEVALGTKAANEPEWAKVIYTGCGKTTETEASLEEGLRNGKGIAFYYDADSLTKTTDTVTVQFATADGATKSQKLTFDVTLGCSAMEASVKDAVAAILGTGDSNLNGKQNVTYTKTSKTVKIVTSGGMTKHASSVTGQDEGAYVGFEIALDTGKAGEPTWTKLTYWENADGSGSGKTLDPLETVSNSGKGIAMYYDVTGKTQSEGAGTKYLTVQFEDANGVKSAKMNYTVDLTEAYEDTSSAQANEQ